jgi:hypothetical protein
MIQQQERARLVARSRVKRVHPLRAGELYGMQSPGNLFYRFSSEVGPAPPQDKRDFLRGLLAGPSGSLQSPDVCPRIRNPTTSHVRAFASSPMAKRMSTTPNLAEPR